MIPAVSCVEKRVNKQNSLLFFRLTFSNHAHEHASKGFYTPPDVLEILQNLIEICASISSQTIHWKVHLP